MGIHFAHKQSHMVTGPDDVFKTWSTIIHAAESGLLKGKNPNSSNLRCLCGLKEDEVNLIQEKILDGSILISKGSTDSAKEDMADHISKKKQDKILKEGLFQALSHANPSKKFNTWKDMSIFYFVTQGILEMIKTKCAKWISSKVIVDKAAMEFPSDVQVYVKWIVDASASKHITSDHPWFIPVLA